MMIDQTVPSQHKYEFLHLFQTAVSCELNTIISGDGIRKVPTSKSLFHAHVTFSFEAIFQKKIVHLENHILPLRVFALGAQPG